MEPYIFDKLPQGPFAKLRQLIAGTTPKMSIFDMSIGDPKHQFPKFVQQIIIDNMSGFGNYPDGLGIESLRNANANWLNRRFKLENIADMNQHICTLNGTREGLFNAALLAVKQAQKSTPIMAIPDPFYQVYAAGAIAAQAEIIFMPTPKSTGFLPDLGSISDAQWQNMAVFFICSPSNPQGAFADKAYYEKLIALARKHDFYIFSDECYSEIYYDEKPISALEVAAKDGDFKNVISFFSLSKRSSLPGLRSGFCAGDATFIARYKKMRVVAAPQVPGPLQHVATAVWNDEQHVVESRALYAQKIDIAEQILGNMFDFERPQGGFFLWLNMAAYGGGVKAAQDLWQHCAIKALPGCYLSSLGSEGGADDYLRVALVGNLADTKSALKRMTAFYSNINKPRGAQK